MITIRQLAEDINERPVNEVLSILSLYSKKDQDIRAFLMNVVLEKLHQGDTSTLLNNDYLLLADQCFDL